MSPKAHAVYHGSAVGYSESDGRRIVDSIHAMVDAKAQVRIRQESPRTAAGKYRWVLNGIFSVPAGQSQAGR